MADKDGTRRKVVREYYPECSLLICLFHSLRSFKREVRDSAYEMTESQQNTLKKIFQKMAYTPNKVFYMEQYNLFLENSSAVFSEYFIKNWHGIREQWVRGYMFVRESYFNTTNNRLESFNRKLKSVTFQLLYLRNYWSARSR